MFKLQHLYYLLGGLERFSSIITYTTYFIYFTRVLGLSNAQAVMLDAPVFVMGLLFEIPSGIFADRFGYKRTYVISIVIFIMANLIYATTDSYRILMFGSTLFGIGTAFFSGAFEALCIEFFKPDIKRYVSNQNIINYSIAIVGPIMAYALAESLGYRYIYLLATILKIVILFLVVLFVKERTKVFVTAAIESANSFIDESKQVWKIILANRFLRLQIIASLLWGLSAIPIDNYWSQVIAISWDVRFNGFVFAAASLAGVFGSIVARRSDREKFIYWSTFLVNSIFIILMGILVGSKSVIFIFVIRGLFISMHDVVYSAMVNMNITSHRASILSVYAFLPRITNIISIMIVGVIADRSGYGPTWILSGVIMLGVSFVVWLQVHDTSGSHQSQADSPPLACNN